MAKVYRDDDFARFPDPFGLGYPERDIAVIDDLLFESTVVGSVSVLPSDTVHQQAADSPSITQVHNLIVSDARHGHIADNVTIIQTHNVSVSDAFHALSSDVPTVGQSVSLIVSKAFHRLTSDNVVVDTPSYKPRLVKLFEGGVWVSHYIRSYETTWNNHNLNTYN